MDSPLKALEGHDTTFLLGISHELKQVYGGEGWAIGEMVQRAVKLYGESGIIVIKKGDEKC